MKELYLLVQLKEPLGFAYLGRAEGYDSFDACRKDACEQGGISLTNAIMDTMINISAAGSRDQMIDNYKYESEHGRLIPEAFVGTNAYLSLENLTDKFR